MIKPGTNLCRVCGKTSSINFYRSGVEDRGAQLVWDPSRNTFTLKSPDTDKPQVGMKLIDPDQYIDADFPPNKIQVRGADGKDAVTMYRSCPHCEKEDHEIFPPDMGKLPCYVIAVIGAVSAGKTAWLGALNNALDALGKQYYPYKIEPWKLRTDVENAQSTRGYENGNTNYFLIINVQTGDPVAMIYLLDYAGELYDHQEINYRSPLGKILLGKSGKGYPGLDAAVFIEPAVDDILNKERAGTEKVIKVIENMEFRSTLRKIPVARVCTFADKLLELESEILRQNPARVPRLTENTFPRTVYSNVGELNAGTNRSLRHYYTPNAIVRRIRLQGHIAEGIIDTCQVGKNLRNVLSGYNRSFAHFLVQSCNHIPPTNPEDRSDPKKSQGSNDYRIQFNTADPLIWLLYQLELFPLFLSEGGTR